MMMTNEEFQLLIREIQFWSILIFFAQSSFTGVILFAVMSVRFAQSDQKPKP